MREFGRIVAVTFGICVSAVVCSASAANVASPLDLTTSDSRLRECFVWAKAQAMAYVRQGDPVGLWYEAALPGRHAFCMRDVSHQATGAHALGLSGHTIDVRHNGQTETILTNKSSKPLTWIASFCGHPKRLWVGDESVVPSTGVFSAGDWFAGTKVQVEPGATVTVRTTAPNN